MRLMQCHSSLSSWTQTGGNENGQNYEAKLIIPKGGAEGDWTIRSYMRDMVGGAVTYGFYSTDSFPFPGPGSGVITVGTGGTGEPATIYGRFSKRYSLQGPDALPGADPDHDGIMNVVELLLGTNPTESNGMQGRISLSSDGELMHLDFTVGATLTASLAGGFLEVSDGGSGAPLKVTGQGQNALGGPWTQVSPTLLTGNTYRINWPLANSKGFLRLFFVD